MLDDGVHGCARFDHDLCFAWALEGTDEFLECLGEDEVFSFSARGLEGVHDGGGAIIDGDVEAAAFHVEDEIFAHDGEADEADVASIRGAHVIIFDSV